MLLSKANQLLSVSPALSFLDTRLRPKGFVLTVSQRANRPFWLQAIVLLSCLFHTKLSIHQVQCLRQLDALLHLTKSIEHPSTASAFLHEACNLQTEGDGKRLTTQLSTSLD